MKRVSVYVKVSFRRLNDILQCNKTHYPINSYNKKCYTNMTIKQPYYCYKARHKCKLCSKKYKSFNPNYLQFFITQPFNLAKHIKTTSRFMNCYMPGSDNIFSVPMYKQKFKDRSINKESVGFEFYKTTNYQTYTEYKQTNLSDNMWLTHMWVYKKQNEWVMEGRYSDRGFVSIKL